MANKDAPFGLRPVGELGSSIQNAGTTRYPIEDNLTQPIYNGDLVYVSDGTVQDTGASASPSSLLVIYPVVSSLTKSPLKMAWLSPEVIRYFEVPPFWMLLPSSPTGLKPNGASTFAMIFPHSISYDPLLMSVSNLCKLCGKPN